MTGMLRYSLLVCLGLAVVSVGAGRRWGDQAGLLRTRRQHAPVQYEVTYHLYSHSTYLLIQQSVGWFGNYADD